MKFKEVIGDQRDQFLSVQIRKLRPTCEVHANPTESTCKASRTECGPRAPKSARPGRAWLVAPSGLFFFFSNADPDHDRLVTPGRQNLLSLSPSFPRPRRTLHIQILSPALKKTENYFLKSYYTIKYCISTFFSLSGFVKLLTWQYLTLTNQLCTRLLLSAYF